MAATTTILVVSKVEERRRSYVTKQKRSVLTRVSLSVGLLLIAGLVGFYLFYVQFSVFEPFITVTSPKNLYSVILSGQKTRPRFFTAEVRFDVTKNGRSYVSDQLLHSGDAFDKSFDSGYPNHAWLFENVLRFYRKDNFDLNTADTISISNKTKNRIKYLKVYSSLDKFLIFDLTPGSIIELKTSSSRNGLPEIYTEGEFSSGKRFSKGSSFEFEKESMVPLSFLVTFDVDEVKIESRNKKEM